MSHFFWIPCHFPPARSQSALLVKRWVDEPVEGEVVLGEVVSGVVGEPLGGAGGMPGVFGMLPPGGEPGRLDGAGLEIRRPRSRGLRGRERRRQPDGHHQTRQNELLHTEILLRRGVGCDVCTRF